MKPAIKDSDLVLYYRLDKNFVSGDVVVFKKNDRIMMSRVVAVAGDQVDITKNGLLIKYLKIFILILLSLKMELIFLLQ